MKNQSRKTPRKTGAKSAPKTSSAPQSAFTLYQEKYNLITPEQIQMRILWTHIKLLITDAYGGVLGEDPNTKKALAYYESQWRNAEARITERTKTINDLG